MFKVSLISKFSTNRKEDISLFYKYLINSASLIYNEIKLTAELQQAQFLRIL